MNCHNIGIYCRLSRDDNKVNYESIETQIEICKSYIEDNRLGILNNVYLDDNISGTTFDRVGLNKLLQDIELKRIDLIIIKDLSRLGRNNVQTLLFLDFLEERGVELIAIGDNYDTRKDDDDIIGIKTWYNERYAKDISRKIRSSLKERMRRGEHLGKAPYGYQKIEGKNKLIVDENVRYVIEKIFKYYLNGLGYRKIAEILEKERIPVPSKYKNELNKAKGWEAYHIKRIIENREYCGDTVQGVKERISYKNKSIRKRPKEQWIITEQTHEGLVSRETWELANKLRVERGKGSGRHKNQIHLFAGLLICGSCGSNLVARKVRNKPLTYICSKYMRYGTKEMGCTSHSIRDDFLRELIARNLYELAVEIKNIVVGKVNDKLAKENDFIKKIKVLENKLQQNKRRIEVLYNDRLDGNISLNVYKEKSKELLEQSQLFENEILLSSIKVKVMKNYYNNLSSLDVLFDELFKTSEILSKEFVRKVVDKVYVFLPHEVTEKFKEEYNLESSKFHYLEENGGLWIKYNFQI